jgi:tetratricopeptide (TPR) repeat protein
LEKAVAACKWFVEHYSAHGDDLAKDADGLLLIGQAAERYYRATARGEDLSDSLNEVINEIYEAAARADPDCWRAPWLEGRLFLSGYNERAASKELARAQQINPLSPEVLVTLGQADLQGYRLAAGRSKAERALTVNPHYGPAHVLLADLNISDERFDDALAAARKAVAENPRDEDALARVAAACRLKVDPAGAAAAELAALSNSPRPANFYAALGERLADPRPTPPAPTPPSAWGCSTCRSAARTRRTTCSRARSPPTRSTSGPTTCAASSSTWRRTSRSRPSTSPSRTTRRRTP